MHSVNYALIHSVHQFSLLNINRDGCKTKLKIDKNRARHVVVYVPGMPLALYGVDQALLY